LDDFSSRVWSWNQTLKIVKGQGICKLVTKSIDSEPTTKDHEELKEKNQLCESYSWF